MSKRNLLHLPAAVVLGVLLMSAALHSPCLAKSYRITEVGITAQLRRDGSMEVSENRTYRFSGTFSYAYRDMPLGEPVVFEDFEIYEGGRPYELSNSEAPGTYNVSRVSGQTRVRWHYRASDESRTFEFRYRARNAVVNHDDAAILYYKFLSDDWDMPQSDISLRIIPPAPVSRSSINEWLHGPLWAESSISEDGEIRAHCPHLPAGTFLEVRALYPPGLFPGARSVTGEVRQQVMAEEAAWVEEANRTRQEARQRAIARDTRVGMGKYIMIAAAFFGLWGWWRLYNAYGRRPALPQFLDMDSNVPGNTRPALVGYLLHNRQVSAGDLTGTMLDLARRGFVELREEMVKKKGFWGGTREESEYYWDLKRAHWDQHSSELLGFENSLLQFIFGGLAGYTDSVSLDMIKKKRREFIQFFRSWKAEVSELGEKEDWFDRASIRGTYYSVAAGAGMMLLAIPAAFIFRHWAVIIAAAGAVVLVLSFRIYHRTAKGETEARHWKALQKYLKKYEFRSMERRDLLSRMSDYLVYGVVLGLSTQFYHEIAAAIPEREHAAFVPWYVYHGAGARGFSPAAFGEAFSSMVATTTSAMSTASGAGGGATGGGGGGASSGGGGAG